MCRWGLPLSTVLDQPGWADRVHRHLAQDAGLAAARHTPPEECVNSRPARRITRWCCAFAFFPLMDKVLQPARPHARTKHASDNRSGAVGSDSAATRLTRAQVWRWRAGRSVAVSRGDHSSVRLAPGSATTPAPGRRVPRGRTPATSRGRVGADTRSRVSCVCAGPLPAGA